MLFTTINQLLIALKHAASCQIKHCPKMELSTADMLSLKDLNAGSALLGPSYHITWLALRILQCVLALVTNILTIIILACFTKLRSGVIHVYILSLCISDVLFGVVFGIHNCIRIKALLLGDQHLLGLFTRVLTVVATMASIASLVCTTLVGIDRAIATNDPINYKKRMTVRLAKALVCGIWFYLILIASSFSTMQYLSIPPHEQTQIVVTIEEIYPKKIYRFFLLPQIVVVLLSTVVLYWKIAVAVRNQEKKMNPSAQKNDRITRMIWILLGIMIMAWLPGCVVALFKLPEEEADPIGHIAYSIVYNICMLGNGIPFFSNAFVYAGQHKEYRKGYAAILHCKASRVADLQGTSITTTSGN